MEVKKRLLSLRAVVNRSTREWRVAASEEAAEEDAASLYEKVCCSSCSAV